MKEYVKIVSIEKKDLERYEGLMAIRKIGGLKYADACAALHAKKNDSILVAKAVFPDSTIMEYRLESNDRQYFTRTYFYPRGFVPTCADEYEAQTHCPDACFIFRKSIQETTRHAFYDMEIKVK